jgi:hypothetical protein
MNGNRTSPDLTPSECGSLTSSIGSIVELWKKQKIEDSDSEEEDVSTVYQSLSKIIETMNSDNLIIDKKLTMLQNDISYLNYDVAESKKSFSSELALVQKQLIDMRTMVVQLINNNNATLKKIKDDLPLQIKNIVRDELRSKK